MAEHEFFPQPNGKRWCYCGEGDCLGWATYLAWYREYNGTEPDAETIATHRRISKELRDLVAYYSDIVGHDVDFQTALDLAALDWNSGPPGWWV